MKKLIIKDVNKSLYKLEDEQCRKYEFIFEFFDLENKPEINDIIYISAELLNPRYAGYSSLYTFGNLKHVCGKNNISLNDIDVIKVVIKDKEIYLKRLYG